MSDTPAQASPEKDQERQFAVQKIYVKDLSFESPKAPAIFTSQEFAPEINVQLNSEGRALQEGVFEVTLTVTVTAKQGDDNVYLAEVQQAGVFVVKGFPQNELGQMIGAYCPNVLFPYARESVSDLVNRGGFPQLILAPVNFDALYAQHQQQAQQQAAQATDTHH